MRAYQQNSHIPKAAKGRSGLGTISNRNADIAGIKLTYGELP